MAKRVWDTYNQNRSRRRHHGDRGGARVSIPGPKVNDSAPNPSPELGRIKTGFKVLKEVVNR